MDRHQLRRVVRGAIRDAFNQHASPQQSSIEKRVVGQILTALNEGSLSDGRLRPLVTGSGSAPGVANGVGAGPCETRANQDSSGVIASEYAPGECPDCAQLRDDLRRARRSQRKALLRAGRLGSRLAYMHRTYLPQREEQPWA